VPKRLDLSKVPVITEEDLPFEAMAEGILAQVAEDLQVMGLAPYPKPRETPPALDDVDISSMSNEEIGILHMQYTAYSAYIAGELAKYETAYRQASSNLKHIAATLRTKLYSQGKIAKAEVLDRVKDDGIFLKYETESLRLFTMKELTESHYKAFSKSADTVSRIVTIREMDQRREERGHNVGNIRKTPNRAKFGGSRGDNS